MYFEAIVVKNVVTALMRNIELECFAASKVITPAFVELRNLRKIAS